MTGSKSTGQRLIRAARLAMLAAAGPLLLAGAAFAADDRFSGVKVEAIHVNGPVHMLTGAGGNIAVTVGEDGVLIVDDQFLPLAERIQGAINELAATVPSSCSTPTTTATTWAAIRTSAKRPQSSPTATCAPGLPPMRRCRRLPCRWSPSTTR